MGDRNTVVGAYTLHRHLQQYCSHLSNTIKIALVVKGKYFTCILMKPSPWGSFSSMQDLRTGDFWFDNSGLPLFFLRFDDSNCDKNHFIPTAVYCFNDGSVGMQLVALKE